MEIKLTEKQYRKLVELVFLGCWMANSTKEEPDQEYEELEQLIYSYSTELDMEDLLVYDEEYQMFFPTRKFEKLMDPLMQEYDDFVFWEQLSIELAKRDLAREIGPVKKLTENHLERLFELESEYELEFEKNGLRNLVLKKQDKKR